MFWKALKLFILITLLTGIVYPLMITFIAEIIMPNRSSGSLILLNEKKIGSELIAQPFTDDKYFWPRPSAIRYNPLHSGGSNLGPTNRNLKNQIEKKITNLHLTKDQIQNYPLELLFASGSGLDPHISEEAAYYQFDRVAKARALSVQDKNRLIEQMKQLKEGNTFGFLGPNYFNVLKLNIMLDEKFP
jgi:potassium-transporting ATPase KdpC subunit